LSDLIIWARIVPAGRTGYLVVVSSAAAREGEEASATDMRTVEARSKGEAENMRDALIGQVVQAIERRGHNVLRVHRINAKERAT
jgi:hypothetical protein